MSDKRRIKILHIAQSSGGVERYLQALLKYFDKEKFENTLVCSYDYSEKDYESLADGFFNVEMIRDISLSKDVKAIRDTRKLIKRCNPDIIYLHSSKAGAIGRIANMGLKNKCVYNPHGWSYNMKGNKIKRIIYVMIERILSPFCSTIVCISDAEKESALSKKICAEKKLCVIYNGIDFDEYENDGDTITREEMGIPANAFVVGMVGRLSAQKAPDVFVEAAKKIKDRISNSFFIIVGDGEDRDTIEKSIAENGLKNSFCITGWVNNPMMYIKLFDAAMLLSRWEGFGLVLPEYMLAGKPIVATEVDAIPNIISNRSNGILVKADDAGEAAKAVTEIYENKDFASALIQKGKEVVLNRFNVKRVSAEHEKLFVYLNEK